MKNLILHIDTTSKKGFVMLGANGCVLDALENDNPLDHASFLQPAVKKLLKAHHLTSEQISCIAVSNGPGSYTGLRVGLSAAKGLCYVWKKPLVALNSLMVMAKAMSIELRQNNIDKSHNIYLAPMIDARRQEVFFGLYDSFDLSRVLHPQPVILDQGFLSEHLNNQVIYFSGDGSNKWQSMCSTSNARFMTLPDLRQAMALLAMEAFLSNKFSDLAYIEPEYLKSFFNGK